MRVLVAFDKFKGSITARQACAIAGEVLPGAERKLALLPLTDGGDGFCEVLSAARGADGRALGELEAHQVSGPQGTSVRAAIGWVDSTRLAPAAQRLLGVNGHATRIALVEMAAASGLQLLPAEQRNPWLSSSVGTGELLRIAARRADAIVLGIGGSATHDLGLGALQALGLRFLDAQAKQVPPTPSNWPRIVAVDGERPQGWPPLLVACDVDNPLLGERGAAAVFGPQKGLLAGDLFRLEHETERIARLLLAHANAGERQLELPGAGAAGGLGFGLLLCAGARFISGYELVDAWLGLDAAIERSDVVITGEGRFDESSLRGKGPGRVLTRARALGKRCIVVAGSIAPGLGGFAGSPLDGVQLVETTPAGASIDAALATAEPNLRAALQALALREA